MSKLFDRFSEASNHAKKRAASEQSVMALYPEESQWIVETSDENPSEFIEPLELGKSNFDNAVIELFLEYESANDDQSALQAV
jgi:hypothetical protein